MFRDAHQQCLVCKTFLRLVALEELWDVENPTDRAATLRDNDGDGLSSGQRVLLLMA